MRKLTRSAAAAALLCLPLVCLSAPLSKIKEIPPVSSGVGRLYPESSETIKIVVKDERPPDPVLIAGLMERALMSAALIAAYSENPRAAAEMLEGGAKEAVQALGMKTGDGHVLELTVKDFRVEQVMHAFGGLNMITYGNLQTSLKSPDGAELAAKSFRYASWDSSMKLPFPTAYARAAWEATAKTLQAAFPKKPDPEAIQRLLATSSDKNKDDAQRTFAITWLGLVGQDNPSVSEKLFTLFRQDNDQTIYESSAIALARLNAPGAKEEFDAVVTGTTKLKEWDPKTDAEETWTLLHAMAILGGTELDKKIPPTVERHRERVKDVVRFDETGESPKMSAKLEGELKKAKAKKNL